MKAQAPVPLVPQASTLRGGNGYVDGSTPHRPRKVLDWSSWREEKMRYTMNPAAPVILRRVDDRKAYGYPVAYQEGSPRRDKLQTLDLPEEELGPTRSTSMPRSPKGREEEPNLPGAVQSIRTPTGPATTSTGNITGIWTTPRDMNQQLALQAVQAVQALQAQSVQLPIQGRGTSPWTPSNVKAACSPVRREISAAQTELPEARMETEKHKQEVSHDVALPTATATTTTTSKSFKPRLVVPGAEEDKIQEKTPVERKTSRPSSVAGTPEAAPRKIALSGGGRITHNAERPAARPDSPKRKGGASPVVSVVRRDSAPTGYEAKLEEPHSPGHRFDRGGSIRRSRPETTSDGGRERPERPATLPVSTPTSRLTKPTCASAAHADAGRTAPHRLNQTFPRDAENASPGRRRGVSVKCSFADETPGGKSTVSSCRARSASRASRRSPSRDHRALSPTLQERTTTAMQALEHGMEPPGASDKWRVAQLFYETVPRSHAKVVRIERMVQPDIFSAFVERTDGGDNASNCGVAFCAQDLEDLQSTLRRGGSRSSITLVSDAAVAVRPMMDAMGADDMPQAVSLVVVFCSPDVSQRFLGSDGLLASDRPSVPGCEFRVSDVDQLLVAYVIHFQLSPGRSENAFDFEGRMGSPSPERARSQSRQRKVSLTNPLIQDTLQRLPGLREDAAGTVLLSSNSPEAEAVVSLYLQSGGAARLRRPPGVDLREALGGVVVQRFENKLLAQQYLAVQVDSDRGQRFKEDVVWHGTRLKRSDGDASLAHKLQSIAEHGFDPQRCIKGAHAEGGIWVASCPMESFGVGGDGLVAFIICLAKTNFNEWVDTSCARVLQRERVLPLYSLVHV